MLTLVEFDLQMKMSRTRLDIHSDDIDRWEKRIQGKVSNENTYDERNQHHQMKSIQTEPSNHEQQRQR